LLEQYFSKDYVCSFGAVRIDPDRSVNSAYTFGSIYMLLRVDLEMYKFEKHWAIGGGDGGGGGSFI